MLVVKGSNFVHSEKFLRIFQIQIFLFLEYMWEYVMLPVSALNTIVHYNLSHAQKNVEKFSFSKLIIEKVKFFTQSPTKFFCINVLNVGGCLASCLIFGTFLTLNP